MMHQYESEALNAPVAIEKLSSNRANCPGQFVEDERACGAEMAHSCWALVDN